VKYLLLLALAITLVGLTIRGTVAANDDGGIIGRHGNLGHEIRRSTDWKNNIICYSMSVGGSVALSCVKNEEGR
jgi:hypothetical protein